MITTAIEFPALALQRTGVERVDSEEGITRGTLLGLEDGYLHGYEIVDADGRRLHVRSAREASDRGWKKTFDFILNPIVHVELELDVREQKVDLAWLKDRVLKSLRSDHDAFGDDYVEGLVRQVEAAADAPSVIAGLPRSPTVKKR